MAEIKQTPVLFEFHDLVTEMIRKKGIHEGIWALYVEFALVAVNMGFNDADTESPNEGPVEGAPDLLLPTAMIPIKQIGIVQAPFTSTIAVDAAVVNPKPKQGRTKKARG